MTAVTDRKPPGVRWQTWIDRQIDEARERGDFDDLAGSGKPIPGLGQTRDELWWVRAKLKREEIEHLPPTLAILRDREAAIEEALATPDVDQARAILQSMNDRIRYENSHVVTGPPSTAVPIDVERVLERHHSAGGAT